MRQERRRHPRLEIPLETELQLEGTDELSSVTMLDLSSGGAGLLTTFEIPVGTDIPMLRFKLPVGTDGDVERVEVAARVARCEQQAGLGGEAEYLVGLRFVDITRDLFDQIQQFVFQRLRASQKERVQIERPIAIRFDSFDDFVDEVSVNISTSGMFIRTRHPQAPGSVFNFQFQLGEDFSLIEGRAEVVWRRRRSAGPDKVPGMGVKFVKLDVPSRRLIDRLIAQRGETEAEAEAAPQPVAADSESEPAEAEQPAESNTVERDGAAAATAHEKPTTPPELDRAEAMILSLREVNTLRRDADELRGELEEARRGHDQELQELRARLEDGQAVASGELEERLRDAETAHKESERQRDEVEAARDGLQTDLDQARSKADELQRQLDDRTSEDEIERLTTERDTLQAARDRLLSDLDKTDGEADELRRQLGDQEHAAADLQSELDGVRGEIDRLPLARETATEEAEPALAAAREESERLRGELEGTERWHRAIESELSQVRNEARQAAHHAEERETALRAEVENAALAAASGFGPPPDEPRRGRRAIAGAALVLTGALLGILAIAFIEPLGSLAARPPAKPAAGTEEEGPAGTTVAAAEPELAAEPGPDSVSAEQAVRDWASAWSDQRVDDYLNSYAGSFQPPDGQSRDRWAATRRQRIERRGLIAVSVEAARTVELAPERVSVSFDQTYRSDNYFDRVRKTLILAWEDGAWKIAEERIIE